jgi:hypothetical protein
VGETVSQLCCTSWGSQLSACLVQDAPCASPRTAVTYEVVDAAVPSCVSPGDTPCLINAQRSCCVQDCSGSSQCLMAGSALPSCCYGCCQDACYTDGLSRHQCDTSFSAPFDGCYHAGVLLIPAAITQAPAEWSVSLGYKVPLPEGSDSKESGSDSATDGPTEGGAMLGIPTPHTTCAVSTIGSLSNVWPGLLFALVFLTRWCRARHRHRQGL